MVKVKGPLPRTEDIAFIRKAIADVKEITQLHNIADGRVEALRLKICKRIVNALWNRYRKYHRGVKNPPSFLDWLLERGVFHNTYLYHSYETRLYWVYRVIQTTKTKQLALFGQSQDQWGYWYFDLLEELINDRQPNASFRIRLRQETFPHPDVQESVPSMRIVREEKRAPLAA